MLVVSIKRSRCKTKKNWGHVIRYDMLYLRLTEDVTLENRIWKLRLRIGGISIIDIIFFVQISPCFYASNIAFYVFSFSNCLDMLYFKLRIYQKQHIFYEVRVRSTLFILFITHLWNYNGYVFINSTWESATLLSILISIRAKLHINNLQNILITFRT